MFLISLVGWVHSDFKIHDLPQEANYGKNEQDSVVEASCIKGAKKRGSIKRNEVSLVANMGTDPHTMVAKLTGFRIGYKGTLTFKEGAPDKFWVY